MSAGRIHDRRFFTVHHPTHAMKEYRVEVRTYYTKMTKNKNHVAESSQEEAQEIIDGYVADGWRLVSTDATSFGLAVYVYLYFERDNQ